MLRTIIAITVFITIIPCVTLAKEGGAIPAEKLKGGGLQVHGSPKTEPKGNDTSGESGFPKILKGVKLAEFPTSTIGNAIDNYKYFVKKEWKETSSTNGRTYVDFTGWFKGNIFDFSALTGGVSARGVSIKFLVNSNGSYGVVMVSRVEIKTDGMFYSYPLDSMREILKSIYDNKEIKF